MNKRLIGLALGALTVPALGGVAYAVTQSVDDRPAPEVVIPAAPARDINDDNGGDRPDGVSDDPDHSATAGRTGADR